MLALTVWVMVLITRLFQKDKGRFPGGKWGMIFVIAGALSAITWMALFVVGLGILEFSTFPAMLLVIYLLNQALLSGTGRFLVVTYFIGGLAFAYGCAVPVWYSAAIYSLHSFLFDARTFFIGLLIFMAQTTSEVWKRERYLLETDVRANWEDEDARVVVWVSIPLMLLVGLCLLWGYRMSKEGTYGDSGMWVFYSIAICAGMIHVLNKIRHGFNMQQLRWMLFIALVLPALLFHWLM